MCKRVEFPPPLVLSGNPTENSNQKMKNTAFLFLLLTLWLFCLKDLNLEAQSFVSAFSLNT